MMVKPTLTLVANELIEDPDVFGPAGSETWGRSADLRQVLSLICTPVVRGLAAEAARLGVHLDVAVALVAERLLIEADLQHDRPLRQALDRVAATARAQVSLSDCDAYYLRYLQRAAVTPTPAVGTRVEVTVPARLDVRIAAAGGLQAVLIDPDLPAALGWERAAVIAGRTMTEWATLSAYGMVRG